MEGGSTVDCVKAVGVASIGPGYLDITLPSHLDTLKVRAGARAGAALLTA